MGDTAKSLIFKRECNGNGGGALTLLPRDPGGGGVCCRLDYLHVGHR